MSDAPREVREPYETAPAEFRTPAPGRMVMVRRALLLTLALWGLYGLRHPGSFTLMDSVDLPVHETGHLVFAPFGEWLGVAGGTLMQLIMPAAFVWYFWRRDDGYSASVALWWVAQSLGNVATYAADARAQELPLVGGGEHDWAYLLGRAGLMSHDVQIARGIRLVATLLILGSAAWGWQCAARATSSEAAND